MGVKSIIGSAVALAALASCQWGTQGNKTKPAITKDTLVYTYRKIEERAPDCGNKPDSACSTAKITFPVFTGQAQLNDSVVSKITSNTYTGKSATTIEGQAKDFIKRYEAEIAKGPLDPNAPFTLETNAAVIRQDSNLLTIQVDRYQYAGGAHGSDYTGFINWNTKEQKEIKLSDIFTEGYNEKLTSIGEHIFRAQEKLSDTSSLAAYMFKGGKFVLNNNFLVTPIGIRFLYNEYEVKPYSEGPTEILIPYAQIKTLLRPNTVVSQYIRK